MLVLGHPHCKKEFPVLQMETLLFQFVRIASGTVTGRH